MLYPNSRMETYSASRVSLDEPCSVRLEADRVRVEYAQDGETYAYSGTAQGEGHYQLRCEGYPECRATLHRFEGSVFLEGFWVEESGQGMWRIRLGE
ncbi:hypothetical protein CXK94_02580 [Stutzerimonas stutzeri]|uniref:Uncharacterized protein n=1 Tax=Stutzerimonas stutzeri TaxID=316 RepID=A0A2N8T9X5_STUST|nr:hypothetical protein [Stutzerimonas stutzeri]MCQ4327153.1 hypothetical protein [Stutzerimonas stutzeri]PNG11485.1 hypothetical protein CXK94_02580 [Stutzerimonas stutzeri]